MSDKRKSYKYHDARHRHGGEWCPPYDDPKLTESDASEAGDEDEDKNAERDK